VPDQSFVIRLMRPEDIAACTDVYVAAYQAPPYNGCFDERTARAIATDLLRHFPEACFVAEADGEVVGFILCSSIANMKATVEELAVAPESQGQGIGDALLGHALNWLRRQGFRAVELVAHRKAFAYEFYRRRGFRDSESFRLMSIELRAPGPNSEAGPHGGNQ
jgi:ribosomal protein S18 acetylase RimI-like enzyme